MDYGKFNEQYLFIYSKLQAKIIAEDDCETIVDEMQ